MNYLNGLVDLIQSHLEMIDQPDQHPLTANSSSLINHDENDIIDYVSRQIDITKSHFDLVQERRRQTEEE